MRVVVDTNVIISAALKPAGLEARVVALCAEGRCACFVSDALEGEYREVAARKKFERHQAALRLAVESVLSRAARVRPDPRSVAALGAACRDSDDDMVLACALAAQAGYLVTGNGEDFPKGLEAPAIVNARQFLAAFEGESVGAARSKDGLPPSALR